MRLSFSARQVSVVVACIGTISSHSALAYILPASAILESVRAKRASLKYDTLIVHGRALNPETNIAEKTVWRALKSKTGLRTEYKSGSDTEVDLITQGKQYKFSADKPPLKGIDAKVLMENVFMIDSSKDDNGLRGLRALKKHNVKTRTVSFNRFNGEIVWVIGAKPNDLTSPQLWVHKNLKVPVRFIYQDPKTDEQIDIRWLGYGSAQTGEWHPRQIDTFKNGTLTHRLVFHRVEVNPKLDATLLNIPTQK